MTSLLYISKAQQTTLAKSEQTKYEDYIQHEQKKSETYIIRAAKHHQDTKTTHTSQELGVYEIRCADCNKSQAIPTKESQKGNITT